MPLKPYLDLAAALNEFSPVFEKLLRNQQMIFTT